MLDCFVHDVLEATVALFLKRLQRFRKVPPQGHRRPDFVLRHAAQYRVDALMSTR
jgi:hypothetical protein